MCLLSHQNVPVCEICDGWIDGWVYGILSNHKAATLCLKQFSKANGMYKRNYSFKMNIVKQIIKIRALCH